MFIASNFLSGANNFLMIVVSFVNEILIVPTVVDFAHIPPREMGDPLNRREIVDLRKAANIV